MQVDQVKPQVEVKIPEQPKGGPLKRAKDDEAYKKLKNQVVNILPKLSGYDIENFNVAWTNIKADDRSNKVRTVQCLLNKIHRERMTKEEVYLVSAVLLGLGWTDS